MALGVLAVLTALSACGESEDDGGGDGSKGGSGGTAGAAGNSAGAMNGGRAGSSGGGTSGTGAGRGGAGMGGTAGTSAGEGGAGDGGAGDGGDGGTAGSAMGGAGMGGAGMGGAGMGGAGVGGAGVGGAGMGGAGMGGAGMGGAGMGGAGMAGTGGVPPQVNLYFSEYYEGTATPQQSAVEIVNAGTAAVNLTQCSVRVYEDGSGNFTPILLITTLAPGNTYVLCSAQSVSANCDQSNSTMGQVTGNDAVAIVCNGEFQDIIGQIGIDPANGEWGTGNTSTANATIRRNCTVTTGDRNGNDTFTLSPLSWTGFAPTTADLGGRFCVN